MCLKLHQVVSAAIYFSFDFSTPTTFVQLVGQSAGSPSQVMSIPRRGADLLKLVKSGCQLSEALSVGAHYLELCLVHR